MFTSSASFHCHFAEWTRPSFAGATLTSGIGLYSFERPNGYCELWTESQVQSFDSSFKAALAFGYLANLSAIISIIMLIITTCLPFPPVLMKVTGCLVATTALAECFTFLFFASDFCDEGSCKFGGAAGIAIVAILVALLTAATVFKIPPVIKPDNSPPVPEQPGTVTKTETTMPDGTTKTVTTTVNTDGSKTVEEKVVENDEEAAE